MALIKCKECGTDVSNKAAACVKCGAPNPGKTWIDEEGSGWAVLVFAIILIGIAIGIWVWVTSST
jgi:uncharacterized OB-fold protein